MTRARALPVEVLGDGSLAQAGRLLNLSEAEMRSKLPALIARNFPVPDDTTGMIDLDAVQQWRRLRNPSLFGMTSHQSQALDAGAVVGARLKRLADAAAGR